MTISFCWIYSNIKVVNALTMGKCSSDQQMAALRMCSTCRTIRRPIRDRGISIYMCLGSAKVEFNSIKFIVLLDFVDYILSAVFLIVFVLSNLPAMSFNSINCVENLTDNFKHYTFQATNHSVIKCVYCNSIWWIFVLFLGNCSGIAPIGHWNTPEVVPNIQNEG